MGSPFVDAVRILRVLETARNDTPPGRSSRFLSAHLCMNQDELLLALDTLERLGYIVAARGQYDNHWAMACNPETRSIGPLIDTLLLDRAQQGFGGDPALPEAVCAYLKQTHFVALSEVLDRKADPQAAVMVQNIGIEHAKPSREDSNA